MPPLLYPFRPTIARLRTLPDDPGTVAAPRPSVLPGDPAAIAGPRRGPYRPHTDATVAAVRRLIEQTTLTYREIAAKTGVPRRSFGRWARDGGWQRPLFAPRATDTVPTARAGRKLKLRLLAERLRTLAERYVRELEETPGVDLDRLVQALETVKMARLAAMGRRRRRSLSPFVPAQAGTQGPRAHEQVSLDSRVRGNERREACDSGTRAALLEDLRAAGVRVERAPPAALEDFITSHESPRDEPAPRQRGRHSKRNRHHAWLLQRE
jgi:hypothetical protein